MCWTRKYNCTLRKQRNYSLPQRRHAFQWIIAKHFSIWPLENNCSIPGQGFLKQPGGELVHYWCQLRCRGMLDDHYLRKRVKCEENILGIHLGFDWANVTKWAILREKATLDWCDYKDWVTASFRFGAIRGCDSSGWWLENISQRTWPFLLFEW